VPAEQPAPDIAVRKRALETALPVDNKEHSGAGQIQPRHDLADCCVFSDAQFFKFGAKH
jgi:hypothetical protein